MCDCVLYSDVQCMDLFLLPRSKMLNIASLLLSAATVDRLENKVNHYIVVIINGPKGEGPLYCCV